MSCDSKQTIGGYEMNNNLRVILAKQRKTVADAHHATGLSKATVTNIYYERANNPELQTLLKIAEYLDVSIDELLGTAAKVE